MTVDLRAATFGAATDAAFRSWAQGVHDALIACGLVQTSDTGQVDLTTVARPTSNGVDAGYRVYRFADTLQATKPVHIRVDFGTGTNGTAGNAFRLGISVGLGGTDGAGIRLTPRFTNRRNFNNQYNLGGTGNSQYVTGAASEGRIALWCNAPNQASSQTYNYGFCVERMRDLANGDITGDGVIVSYWETGSTSMSFDLLSYGGVELAGVNATTYVLPMQSMLSTVGGAELALCPFMVAVGGKWRTLATLVGYKAADLTPNVDVSIPRFGVTRNYKPIAANNGTAAYWGPGLGAVTNGPAMLWE